MENKRAAVGIDLGTTYSCVGVYTDENVQILQNIQGHRTTPSYVAFDRNQRLVGDAAYLQANRNAPNTIFDAKRLIGRKFDDPEVQRDMQTWPFMVTQAEGEDKKPMINVKYNGEMKQFYPEQISAMV